MNTCYAVIGTSRSGSSALAGTMHCLGVNMGDMLMAPVEDINPKGFFEDLEFLAYHKAMYGEIPELLNNLKLEKLNNLDPTYTTLVRKRCSQSKWGVKDPRMVFILKEFKSKLINCKLKVISTRRPINQSAKSMAKSIRTDYKTASEIIGRYEVARLDALQWLEEAGIETIVVDYKDLVEKTAETVKRIAEFCDVTDEGLIEIATKTIDPKLWNQK
jgi:hypothetical protein